jgi:hypothetical protein
MGLISGRRRVRAELAHERLVVRAKPDSGTGFIATYEHSDFTRRLDWTIHCVFL